MKEIAAIASGKGGVGKSTLSAGIGAALAMRGERVLLIDGDAGLRSLDFLLGVTENLVYDASDIADGRVEPVQAVYESPVCKGLFLLPAPSGKPLPPRMTSAIATVLSRHFDRILIDCPAGLGSGFLSAVAPAQKAYLVATADPVSVRSAAAVRAALEQSGVSEHRLIVNRFSAASFRKAGAYRDLDEVVDTVGAQLLGIVPEDEQIPLCAAQGHLSRNASKKLSAAGAFRRIAARICGESVSLLSMK